MKKFLLSILVIAIAIGVFKIRFQNKQNSYPSNVEIDHKSNSNHTNIQKRSIASDQTNENNQHSHKIADDSFEVIHPNDQRLSLNDAEKVKALAMAGLVVGIKDLGNGKSQVLVKGRDSNENDRTLFTKDEWNTQKAVILSHANKTSIKTELSDEEEEILKTWQNNMNSKQ